MDTNAVAQLATAQGLDPIMDALRDAGIPAEIEHTGGNVVCVTVYTDVARIANYGITSGDRDDGWYMAYYADQDGEFELIGVTLTTEHVIMQLRRHQA
jgi:hypothetical protein